MAAVPTTSPIAMCKHQDAQIVTFYYGHLKTLPIFETNISQTLGADEDARDYCAYFPKRREPFLRHAVVPCLMYPIPIQFTSWGATNYFGYKNPEEIVCVINGYPIRATSDRILTMIFPKGTKLPKNWLQYTKPLTTFSDTGVPEYWHRLIVDREFSIKDARPDVCKY
jgi:hypothetical protein